MTPPLPSAIRLPRNKFITPIVEALPGYRAALDDADAAGKYLRELAPIPDVPLAPIGDDWQLAEDEHDTARARYDRWRNRAISRQNNAIASANSMLHVHVDAVLRELNLYLREVLARVEPDAEVLIAAGVDTADKAIETGLVPEWSRLQQEAWPDYRTLRDSQEAIALHIAPQRMWITARPSIDGEDPANLLWIKNLPELWPDWRERGRTRPQFTITGPTPRPEPWPRPDGAEFLLWAFKAQAEQWIPTMKEFDEAFVARRQQVAGTEDESEQSDDSSPFDSLLFGPLEVERQRQAQAKESSTSFKGHPPPILA
jgi:hypothetical protein